MAYLLSIKNGVPHLRFPVGPSSILGRSSECDIQLMDTELSRKHARIAARDDGTFEIEDLGSRNGTHLNGVPVRGRVPLGDGDQVRIGSHVFCFNPPLDLLSDQRGDKSLLLVHEDGDRVHAAQPLERSSATIDARALLQLHELSARILSELQLDRLLDRLMDELLAYFQAQRGFILGVERESERLRPLVIRTDRESVAMSRTLLDRVLEERVPLLIEDALDDVSFVNARSVVEHDLRSVMLVPLLANERVIGVLQLDHRQRSAFDQDSLARLELLSRSAALALENAGLFERASRREALLGPTVFIGQSEPIRTLLDQVARIAGSDSRVLITGESGTGKELIARMLHESSPRRDEAWVALNCAAMTESLLESELFGHEAGAFTGAQARKRGCFERAHRGTLFLDEVGELSPATQAKLLRALQEGRFFRVGGEQPIDVDVRVMAATNRDLPDMVRAGLFREDLLFRLQVIPLALPPLRERPGDIPLITEHVFARMARRLGKKRPFFSPEARALWHAYSWPGNVRELENAVERLLVLHESALITAAELPAEMRAPRPGELAMGRDKNQAQRTLPEAVAALEREMVTRALEWTEGNKSQAARALGISRPTLDKKIRDHDIQTGRRE